MDKLKHCKIGSHVTVDGKDGIIIQHAGDGFIIVRFQDGTQAHVTEAEVTPVLDLSTVKSCPFCKSHSTREVTVAHKDGDSIYQCMRCSQRYS